MVRLIQKIGYIKSGGAGGYMKYIGTRERVEKLEGSGPVTKHQKKLIEDLLRDFSDVKDLCKYGDYCTAPTSSTASALIPSTVKQICTFHGCTAYAKFLRNRFSCSSIVTS